MIRETRREMEDLLRRLRRPLLRKDDCQQARRQLAGGWQKYRKKRGFAEGDPREICQEDVAFPILIRKGSFWK